MCADIEKDLRTYLYKKCVLFNMEPKRRHHFEWNEIKKSIVEFVLNTEGPVSEPDVNEFLKCKYGEFTRSTVNKHLRALGELGCIESVNPVNKSKFKFWDITTIKNLENIIKEYPDLIDSLQDSEVALNIVLDALEYALIASTDMKNIEEQKENPELKTKLLEIRENVKPKLKMSSAFFKLCIQNEIFLWRNLSDVMEISEEGPVADLFIGDGFKFFISHPSGIDLAFEACIVMDIMERKGNTRKDMKKEINYVKEMKNTVSKTQLDQLKNYYENTDTAPLFLRGKKLVSVCNNELSKIEIEFEKRDGEFINYDFLGEPPGPA